MSSVKQQPKPAFASLSEIKLGTIVDAQDTYVS